jgi:hypothetical protein
MHKHHSSEEEYERKITLNFEGIQVLNNWNQRHLDIRGIQNYVFREMKM